MSKNLVTANAAEHTPSWRMHRRRFGKDTRYIRSGVVNISPGWFPTGSNVSHHNRYCDLSGGLDMHELRRVAQIYRDPPRSTPLLRSTPGKTFLDVGRDAWALVSGVLLVIHPQQYWMAKKVQESMMDRGCCAETLSQWPSVQTAVSVIANRSTPFHRDSKSRTTWFDLITSIGPYRNAPMYLSPIKIRVDNTPGTICAFSGLALRHAVRKCGESRISFAWYLREDTRRREDIAPASWMLQSEYDGFVGRRGIRVSRTLL